MADEKPKFTPGPWAARVNSPARGRGFDVVTAHEDRLAAYIPPGEGESFREANAHLIAAAPDIYAALETLAGEWCNDRCHAATCAEHPQSHTAECVATKAALKKARGEQCQ